MADLATKYQRLAQEYAKIKAQNQVLRAAVINEQENVTSVKDAMRSKEQLLRRSEQEMDSLTFRNQQMERRVELLQEELEKLTNSKLKKKVKAESLIANNHSSAVDEDLRNKIKENELLHKQVHDADSKTRQIERQLTDELTKAQQEAKQYKEVLETSDQKYKNTIDNLQEEKALLEMHLQTAEQEKNKFKLDSEKNSSDLKVAQDSLGNQVQQLSRLVEDTIVFNDCSVPEYTVLNIPPHDRRSQAKAQELLKDSQGLLADFCKGLMNMHSYTEQRSKVFPIDSSFNDLSTANAKLCELLHDNSAYLRPMIDSFDQFCEVCFSAGACPVSLHTAVGLEKFSDSFKNYLAYLSKLIPYQIASIDEECSASICAPTLQSKNQEFRHLYQKFLPAVHKLYTYVNLIASCGSAVRKLPSYNEKAVFLKVLSTLNELHLLFKDMSKVFNAKVAIEHQLPTSSVSLKSTDEFLLSSFLSLSSIMAKLASFVSDNTDFFTHRIPYRTRGVSVIQTESDSSSKSNGTIPKPSASPSIINLCKRSVSYMQKVTPPAPPQTVPYLTALRDHASALSSEESKDGLIKRLQESTERIGVLEQEKEHWLLETQLLQMKLDRLKQKTNLPSTSVEPVSPKVKLIDSNRTRKDSSSLVAVDTSMLGSMETPVQELQFESNDEESREETIKRHLTSRLSDTSGRLQQAESKALHFHTECQALHKHLHISNENLETLQESNNKANQKISQLQDELSVTRKNYEDQLSLMSDHLAAMNDKLSTQKDEIDNLKQPTKLSKKLRNKVLG